jgi:YVTN family beta-propeller protein
MGMSPDGRYVVNTSETTNMAHVIDTDSGEIVANVLVDSRPRVALWEADRRRFWVSRRFGGTVSVVEAMAGASAARSSSRCPGVPPRRSSPSAWCSRATGRSCSWRSAPANRVAVVDVAQPAVERYLLVGQRVWNLRLSPDGSRLYTTNGVSNDMSVIDVAACAWSAPVPRRAASLGRGGAAVTVQAAARPADAAASAAAGARGGAALLQLRAAGRAARRQFSASSRGSAVLLGRTVPARARSSHC